MKIFNKLICSLVTSLFLLCPPIASAEEWTYTTRPNDTLWDISQKYLKSVTYWERLQKHNSVNIAKQLAPGTRLRIPLEWLKMQAVDATVVSITGKVELVRSESTKAVILSSKESISIGSKIITGDNGSALIQFADSSTLLIQKNSQVVFNTLSSYGKTGMVDTRLRLQKGRVETSVTPMKNSGSRYEIKTPAAVAAVRGTQFRVAYENNQQTMASEVVKGEVSVAAEGIEQSLIKGFGTITEKGKAPQPPVKLLIQPDLKNIPNIVKYLPFTFKWPELENAVQYRVQISPAEQQNALIHESNQNSEQFTLNTLNDGQYILRIRGIDENGLEGFNAKRAFTLDTDFPVVTLISPAHKLETSNKALTFKWKLEKKAASYQLQIATDIQFSNLIVDQISTKNTLTIEEGIIQDGDYFWRITAIDENKNKGKPSEAREFSIEKNTYEGLLLLLYFIPALIL